DNTDDGLGWWTRFTYHVRHGYYGYPYDYLKHPERHLPRISEHGGGSPCGGACYNEAVWPAQYRGNPFFAEWGKGKVQRFILKPKGASFEATIEDFLVNDGTGEFRPVDLCFSPDGRHMYVADWNFGGWVNPKVCGRVFRVTHESGLAKAATEAGHGIAALSSPSFHARTLAQRTLAKQGAASREALVATLNDANAPSAARVHALWALAQSGLTAEALDTIWSSLKDAPADLKVQAARVVGDMPTQSQVATQFLRTMSHDKDAAVRLAAHTANRAKEFPGLLATNEDDEYARFARRRMVRRNGLWKEAQEALESNEPRSVRDGLLALASLYAPPAVNLIAAAARNDRLPSSTREAALEALAELHRKAEPYRGGWWGTQPAKHGPARAKTIEWEGTQLVLEALVAALGDREMELRKTAAALCREVPNPAAPAILRKMMEHDSEAEVRTEATRTLATLKDRESVAGMARLLASLDQPERVRVESARGLGTLGDSAGVTALAAAASEPRNSMELAGAALEALQAAGGSSKEAAAAVAGRLHDRRAPLRAKAIAALAKLEGTKAAAKIEPLLKDHAPEVRQSAAQALGSVKARNAITALMTAAAEESMRFDATLALAAMPDRRALAPFLAGLVDKNPE
ncbi:MAG TPA: HEAT repeat domain-containing protein, partial [Planctomycetia bacterium]|nr:HEAT repeat domain-containing protein [Planctomycetia bacterium]